MYKQIIILIDDDQIFREVLARSLSNKDFTVFNYASPDEALPNIENLAKDEQIKLLILLDLKLDGDSGLRWIKKIRETNTHCKIVLLTGYASISTAVEAIKLGADDYLTKPITSREIVSYLAKNSEDDNPPNHAEVADMRPMSVERLEWEHIQKVLNDHDGNISASARALGMHRRTLQRKLNKKPVNK